MPTLQANPQETTYTSRLGLKAVAIAVLAAWLQLGERPSPAEFAGMALIALALSLLALLNMKPPSRGD